MAENGVPDMQRRVAASRDETARAADRLAELAGRIAETEDEVAAARERMAATAAPAAAERHLRSAREAREFAEHERAEQRRWGAGPDRSATERERPRPDRERGTAGCADADPEVGDPPDRLREEHGPGRVRRPPRRP